MARRTLTDRFCASAKARDGEMQTDYFDEQTPGLALRVSRAGLRSWTFHFTQGGKRNRLTFGNYPAISLVGARNRRKPTSPKGQPDRPLVVVKLNPIEQPPRLPWDQKGLVRRELISCTEYDEAHGIRRVTMNSCGEGE